MRIVLYVTLVLTCASGCSAASRNHASLHIDRVTPSHSVPLGNPAHVAITLRAGVGEPIDVPSAGAFSVTVAARGCQAVYKYQKYEERGQAEIRRVLGSGESLNISIPIFFTSNQLSSDPEDTATVIARYDSGDVALESNMVRLRVLPPEVSVLLQQVDELKQCEEITACGASIEYLRYIKNVEVADRMVRLPARSSLL